MYKEPLDLDTRRIRNEAYNSPDFTTLSARGFEYIFRFLDCDENKQPVMFEAGKENGSFQRITDEGTFIFKDINGKTFELATSYTSDSNFWYRYNPDEDPDAPFDGDLVYETDANDKRTKINALDIHKTLVDMITSERFAEAAVRSQQNYAFVAKKDFLEDLHRTFNDMESDILVFDNDFVVTRESDGSILFDDNFDLDKEIDNYVNNYFYSEKKPIHPILHTSLVEHPEDALYKEARQHEDEIGITAVDKLNDTIQIEEKEIQELKDEAKEKNVSFSDEVISDDQDLSELMENTKTQIAPVTQTREQTLAIRQNVFAQWAHDVHEANHKLSSGIKNGLHLLGVSIKDKFKSALHTVKEDVKFIYNDVKEEQSERKSKRYSNRLYYKEKIVDWLAPGLRDTVKQQSAEIADLKDQLAQIKIGRENAQDNNVKRART